MIVFIGALLIGITLGLLGSGGSILTVPVLVYVLGHEDKVAIAESLAIVGAIALAGIFPYARAKLVDWRSVVYFGIPGMAGTYGGAWLAQFLSGAAQLVLFAVVMLLAAGLMFRNSQSAANSEDESTDPDAHDLPSPHRRHPMWQVALEGVAVGVLTGLVGVGGGFLIVPALVILGGLPMRTAVGTSLAIIALKSFAGFYKYLGVLDALELHVDWKTMGLFVAIGILGTVVGKSLSAKIDQGTLRKVFAVFLVAIGVVLLGKEAPKMFETTPTPQQSTAAAECACFNANQQSISITPGRPG